MSIQEMKEAVAQMPPDELDEFALWLSRYRVEHAHPVTFDAIRHLVGVVEGPGDLSTNPKYMDDFGKSSAS